MTTPCTLLAGSNTTLAAAQTALATYFESLHASAHNSPFELAQALAKVINNPEGSQTRQTSSDLLEAHKALIATQLCNTVYGRALDSLIQFIATDDILKNSAPTAALACHVLALSCEHSLSLVLEQQGGTLSIDFMQQLENLQSAFYDKGALTTWIDDLYAMSPQAGRTQVEFMDSLLGKLGSHENAVQTLLARANYSLFRPDRTMSSGIAMFERASNMIAQLSTLTDSANRAQGMPHLDRSNVLMGDGLKSMMQSEQVGKVVVVGAGLGGTTACGLISALEACTERPELALPQFVNIEPAEHFLNSLYALSEFAAFKVGRETTQDFTKIDTLGCDIASALSDSRTAQASGTATVFLANYVFHRISTNIKGHILAEIYRNHDSPIVLIGDLVANSSAINRRCFNWVANGLMNTGNQTLPDILRSAGYCTLTLEDFSRLSRLPAPLIRAHAGARGSEDELFLIAYKDTPTCRMILGLES